MNDSNINLKWCEQFSNTIANLGITDICICPGSRNTPLTVAFTNNSIFDCTSHIDERSASFFALGISKKKNIPSIVISTSGTAVANFFPAIIESNLSKTPLIIITADRPSSLVNSGENQTINQIDIFGDYVRKFENINLLTNKISGNYDKIISLFQYAIGDSEFPPGPVHINIPFEEPLIESLSSNDLISKKISIDNRLDYDRFTIPNLNDSIIVCGEIGNQEPADKLLELSEYISAPILADPASNIRYLKEHDHIISNYNLFLDKIDLNPKTIIRFGRKPTSKLLCDLLKTHSNVIYVDRYPTFNDSTKKIIKSDINFFVNHILASSEPITQNINLSSLISYQKKINPFINKIDINHYKCEGALINNILDTIDARANIFIGNSMAIREMDDLTNNMNKKINIYCNRGASGIDGLVSTALGISQSSENENQSNIAILGDLSFYHDMNGLLAASKMDLNMKFVILNNNGGGIFSNMKIAKLNYSKFEEFWTTPLNLELNKIADLYNLRYTEIKNTDDLEKLNRSNTKAEIFDYKIAIEDSIRNKDKILSEVEKLIKD